MLVLYVMLMCCICVDVLQTDIRFKDLQCCIGLCKYPQRGGNEVHEITERCGHMQWNLKEKQEVKQAWVTVMVAAFPMGLGTGFFLH